MDRLSLRIITPTKLFIDQEVECVNMTTIDGDITVYKNHTPLISSLTLSKILVRNLNNKEEMYIHVHRGLLNVTGHQVKIITSNAYFVDKDGNKI